VPSEESFQDGSIGTEILLLTADTDG